MKNAHHGLFVSVVLKTDISHAGLVMEILR